MDHGAPKDAGRLLELIVHDLRNPVASLGANHSFLEEVAGEGQVDEDVPEALQDMRTALAELRQGLDQVAWIGRWMTGEAALSPTDGDVVKACQHMADHVDGLRVEVESGSEAPLPARGGGTLPKLLELLLMNARQHGAQQVTFRPARDGDAVCVELVDDACALADELGGVAFTIEGQPQLKGRPGGRYSRVAGLLAARALADAMNASLESDARDGNAVFRIRLQGL